MITEVEDLLFLRLYSLMTYIEGPETCEVLTKNVVHFDQLGGWQKTDVNRRLLIDFF